MKSEYYLVFLYDYLVRHSRMVGGDDKIAVRFVVLVIQKIHIIKPLYARREYNDDINIRTKNALGKMSSSIRHYRGLWLTSVPGSILWW
jgi:hypothetical protein